MAKNEMKTVETTGILDDEDSSNQFVTFQVAGVGFGLPMDQVVEIIRLPKTVGVPLTPNALVGLANLRGNVLPILDLRRILELEETEYSDASRVIVTDVGRRIGLIVDKVAKVVNVDESSIEKAESVQSATNIKLLSGVIRVDEVLIQLLDIEELIKQDFSEVMGKNKNPSNATLVGEPLTNADEDEDEAASQLVSFTVDNQEYAFDLMSVEEIVRVPQHIAEMPSTDHHILGMIDLRGRLLPLVSLRRMFSLAEVKLSDINRVLVIGIRAPGGILNSIAIVVDEVREVLSVSMSARDKVPSLLTGSNSGSDDISAVCRLDEGKRLVSILSAEAMFENKVVQAAMAANINENKQMSSGESEIAEELSEDENTQMVVFKLAKQEYGITIEDVQEITRIPDAMSKVPKTPTFIEGMVNLRGTVLPVLDMRLRFGLEQMERNERQRILVLNLNGNRTGFIMDSVVEVLRLNRNSIEPSPDLSDDQIRVMGRVVNMKEDGRMIQVLNVHELLSENEEKTLEEL
ncbi:MAG: purine-binding chemotaxis protein CheW [Oleiphilaceae bacterium]|jgi:purine-binding chemotaxis protein CheW